jgi:hypothetical protein
MGRCVIYNVNGVTSCVLEVHDAGCAVGGVLGWVGRQW